MTQEIQAAEGAAPAKVEGSDIAATMEAVYDRLNPPANKIADKSDASTLKEYRGHALSERKKEDKNYRADGMVPPSRDGVLSRDATDTMRAVYEMREDAAKVETPKVLAMPPLVGNTTDEEKRAAMLEWSELSEDQKLERISQDKAEVAEAKRLGCKREDLKLEKALEAQREQNEFSPLAETAKRIYPQHKPAEVASRFAELAERYESNPTDVIQELAAQKGIDLSAGASIESNPRVQQVLDAQEMAARAILAGYDAPEQVHARNERLMGMVWTEFLRENPDAVSLQDAMGSAIEMGFVKQQFNWRKMLNEAYAFVKGGAA